MRPTTLLASGLLLVPCSPAPAQETDDTPQFWLQVLTRDAGFAGRVAGLLGAEPVEFELEGTERARIAIDTDGNKTLRELPVGGHPNAWAELFLRVPDFLGDLLEQHEKEVARAGLQADVVMRQVGYPAGYGEQLFGQVLSIIQSVGGVYARIEGDPAAPAEGVTLYLDLAPQAKTELYEWIRTFAPNFRGAPEPPVEDALASVRLSLSKDALRPLLAPFADLVCKRGAKTEAEEERNQRLFETWLEAFDGTWAGSFDGERFVGYQGLDDPDAGAGMLADEQYQAWVREAGTAPGVDVEVRAAALEHRGVVLMETTVHSEVPNPLMPEGKTVSYRGVANGYEVTVAGASLEEAGVAAELDRVLDAGPKRSEPPDNGIFLLDLDLKRALDLLPPELGDLLPPRESVPETFRLLVHKIGITLKLRLELR